MAFLSSRTEYIIRIWAPVILYGLLILFASGSTHPPRPMVFDLSDKVLHAGAYAVLGALLARALATLPSGNRQMHVLLLSVFYATSYGLLNEGFQYFIPSRQADLWDAAANAVGSLIGASITIGMLVWLQRRKRNLPD